MNCDTLVLLMLCYSQYFRNNITKEHYQHYTDNGDVLIGKIENISRIQQLVTVLIARAGNAAVQHGDPHYGGLLSASASLGHSEMQFFLIEFKKLGVSKFDCIFLYLLPQNF